jgi:hypothetical protein
LEVDKQQDIKDLNILLAASHVEVSERKSLILELERICK